ncbi:MAG: zinc ABC transporter substrate-binding protein [Actinomycetaceae bacterium]|nr:zinc ABC transporter substrate-binding protein [Actinomycetaceae bacterium]
MVFMNIRKTLLAVGAASALVLSGCAATGDASDEAGDKLVVKASFYPLQYLVEEIGQDKVAVASLTPPGTDAHALELSPKTVAELSSSDAVVYLHGFQSAVDEAVAQGGPEHVLDVTEAAKLAETGAKPAHDHGDADDAHDDDAHEGETHEGDDTHEAEDAHDHGDADDTHDDDAHEGHNHDLEGDPHFWLDPARMADVAVQIGDFLGETDPENLDFYKENAQSVAKSMHDLEEELVSSLGQCKLDTFVVSHQAFGYLAAKAGLTQVGISGLEPEVAPSPERLKEIGEVVKEHGVGVIYAEANVSPKAVEVLASDLGVETMTLDPGASQNDPDSDYMDIMRTNIKNLQKGLDCK